MSAAVLKKMRAMGLSLDQAIDLFETMEASAAPEKPISAAAERTRRWRERKEAASHRDVTVTSQETCHGDVSHVGEGAPVVISSLSSLPSEAQKEVKPPVKPNGLTAPRGAEARGCRLPENWRPVQDYDPAEYGLGQEQHAAELAKFLDYWRSVPGAKGRKSDWPATWRNWMRRASENSTRKAPHERPHHDAKLNAKQANFARHDRAFDVAARLHDREEYR